MNLGQQLKYCREEAELSQLEVSKRTGITQAAISRWEDNQRIPNILNCIILAETYGITLDELVGKDTLNKSNVVNYNNSTHNGNNNF